ncbi:tRNA 2-thiouridine(34) synthase MnmA [bacterium]|nr:tRNA 2-thiouridine(34) synthase MnmA [bacterium]
MNKKKKKIIVAMSGGADSSVAAGLLKKQGYDVVGVFARFWKSGVYAEAEEKAGKAAKILNIPLHIISAEKEFKKEIVDYFLRGCATGNMFNPCVKCNPEIKFKFLLDKMAELKCDLAATGHYARRRREIQNPKLQIPNKLQATSYKLQAVCRLFQARDENKDQSYFLYRLKQEQLAKIVFPLGDYRKSEVLEMAGDFNFPEFKKKDESQGACFIAEKYPGKFLKENLKMKTGKIVDARGNVLGEHQGLPLYITGQRRMINIGGTGPYYVIGRDFSKNLLVVTNNGKDPCLYKKSTIVKNVNWIAGAPKLPLKAKIKIRYQHPAVCATISKKKAASNKRQAGFYEVVFDESQRAVVAGQSAVFYSDEGEALGGGIIAKSENQNSNVKN